MRTVATGAGQDLYPVAAAWGPGSRGRRLRLVVVGDNATTAKHVKFAPMSAAAPDIEVMDVRPVQVAQDAARLAAGRPTTIRTMLRSRAPMRATVGVKIELAYDDDEQRVERTLEDGSSCARA